MEIASSPKIPGLRLSPVCGTTLEIMCQAHELWSPETHHLFPQAFREIVYLVLLIANRHFDVGVRGHLGTEVRNGTEVVAKPLALPEVAWLKLILPFLGRDDFCKLARVVLCENCGGAGAEANCPKCHGGHYCDREKCWRAAWPDHKHRCSWHATDMRKKIDARAKAWAKAGAGSAAEYAGFPPKTRKLADALLAKRKEAEEGLEVGGDLYTRLVRELRDLEKAFEAAPKQPAAKVAARAKEGGGGGVASS